MKFKFIALYLIATFLINACSSTNQTLTKNNTAKTSNKETQVYGSIQYGYNLK